MSSLTLATDSEAIELERAAVLSDARRDVAAAEATASAAERMRALAEQATAEAQAAAAGIHAARWALNPPAAATSPAAIGPDVSQAVPRPSPTDLHTDPDPDPDPDLDPDPDAVLQRQAWLHALHRQLNQLAHDIWTPAGLGHHAARLHAALTDTAQSPQQLAARTGYRRSTVDHHLDRLHQAGLIRPDPGGWRGDRLTDADRAALADRLGVAGILAARRRRHAAEREAWAWWGEELTWMRAPRPHPDLPHPDLPPLAPPVRSLTGPTRRQRYGPHPRRANRRADFTAALTTITATITAAAPRNAAAA